MLILIVGGPYLQKANLKGPHLSDNNAPIPQLWS